MAVDAEASVELEEWLADLRALYAQIESWLAVMEHPPRLETHTITVNEQRSGPYEAEELVLTYQGRRMTVRPIARWVAGADGRVDLICADGPFILVNLKDRGGWQFLADRAVFDLRPLDGELFRRLVVGCLQ